MAEYNPSAESLILLERVKAVIAEYRAHLPPTIRQIWYRLIGLGVLAKTDQSYTNFADKMNRFRRGGLIEFDVIHDGGTTIAEPFFWINRSHMLNSFIRQSRRFRLDRQEGQPAYLLIACEAAGMVPQLQHVAGDYGIPVFSSGGFESTTEKYNMAKRLGEHFDSEVLHIGDYDNSGESMFTAFMQDVQQFAADLGLGIGIEFTRLAVTLSQVREYDLPTAPPARVKRKPDGSLWRPPAFSGTGTVQAEALPPDVLADIVSEAVEERVVHEAYDAVLAEEERVRQELEKTPQDALVVHEDIERARSSKAPRPKASKDKMRRIAGSTTLVVFLRGDLPVISTSLDGHALMFLVY